MYEMALRRQDVIELTYSQFLNEINLRADAYCIKFYCTKQNSYRTVDISLDARDAVLQYRNLLEKRGITVQDSDKLF